MTPPRRFRPVHSAWEITPQVVTERLSYQLQKFVGTGRRWSYFGVAARTQIDVRTLKAYVQGTACPSLAKYNQLLAVLGPEIGIETNMMKGWPPRSAVVPPEAVDLLELRRHISQSVSVLDEVLGLDDFGAASLERDDEIIAGSDGTDGIESLAEFRRPLNVEDMTPAAVAARLGYRLQKMIGPGRPWSLVDVSEATGIDRRTLQSYVSGEACPNLTRYHRLGFVLGTQIGVELAYMVGWEPRYSEPLNLPRQLSEELDRKLREAICAIDAVVHADPDSRAVRFIRRNDRTADTGRQATPPEPRDDGGE